MSPKLTPVQAFNADHPLLRVVETGVPREGETVNSRGVSIDRSPGEPSRACISPGAMPVSELADARTGDSRAGRAAG